MGYYTQFRMTVEGSGPVYDKLMNEKDNINFSDYDWVLGRWLSDSYDDTYKWYDWQKDMEQLSSEWPNVLFILEGDGEENGDMWKAWFRNGQSHKLQAKIVFETIKPDLDKILPVDTELEVRIAAEHRETLLRRRDEIEKQLFDIDEMLYGPKKSL